MLTLDAYLPETADPLPTAILIHGSYWQIDDKREDARPGEWLADHGSS